MVLDFFGWNLCHDQEAQDGITNRAGSHRRISGFYRVIRGGSFGFSADFDRCANRDYRLAALDYETIGFRCVRRL